jgi:hypothetical protein
MSPGMAHIKTLAEGYQSLVSHIVFVFLLVVGAESFQNIKAEQEIKR